MKAVGVSLLLLLAIGGCRPIPGPQPDPVPVPAPETDKEAALLNAVNAIRRDAGKPPLVIEARLTQAAQKHSVHMANVGKMEHSGIGDGTPFERISAEGYQWSSAGENIAMGYTTVESVVAGWKGSPGHYRNMIGNFTETGFGVAYRGNAPYWTQVFGTPARQGEFGMTKPIESGPLSP